jgi:hypothetical protein
MITVLLVPLNCLAGSGGAGAAKGSGSGSGTGSGSSSPTATASGAASTVIYPKPVCSTGLFSPSDKPAITIDSLILDYQKSDMSDLQTALDKITRKLLESDKCKDSRIPQGASISFAIRNDIDTPISVIRVVGGRYHKKALVPDWGSQQRIVAQKSGPLYTVFLERDKNQLVYATYAASATLSPVLAAGASATSAAAGALAKVPSPAQGGLSLVEAGVDVATPPEPPAVLYARVEKVESRKGYKWAQIAVTDTIAFDQLLSVASLVQRLGNAGHRYDAFNEPFVEAFALRRCFTYRQGAASDTDGKKSSLQQCYDDLDTAHQIALKPKPQQEADVHALHVMYKTIVDASAGAAAPAPLTTNYTYGPPTHWAFGLGAGAMGLYWHRQATAGTPATTGKPATPPTDNPPSGAFTSVNMYYSKNGYDETRLDPSHSEQVRFVTGVALTPDPGVFLGISKELRFSRGPTSGGLTVNCGYAVMSATILDRAKTKRGALGAAILGLGYSFDKPVYHAGCYARADLNSPIRAVRVNIDLGA